jgi:hypothetical protein
MRALGVLESTARLRVIGDMTRRLRSASGREDKGSKSMAVLSLEFLQKK